MPRLWLDNQISDFLTALTGRPGPIGFIIMISKEALQDFLNAREDSRQLLSRSAAKTLSDIRDRSGWFVAWKHNNVHLLSVLSGTFEDQTCVGSLFKRYSEATRGVFAALDAQLSKVHVTQRCISALLPHRPLALAELCVFGAQLAALRIVARFQDKTFEMMGRVDVQNTLTCQIRRFPLNVSALLMASFEKEAYPVAQELTRLHHATGLSEKQIAMWFTNRRCRAKRVKTMAATSTDHEEEPSDTNTHSPPNSPRQSSTPRPTSAGLPIDPDDDFFAENRRQAQIEFYQTMICNNTRHNWDDFAEFFAKDLY